MSAWKKHQIFEKNSLMLIVGIVVMISIGGLVEIVPLFYLKSTIEKTEGMRPYTPLELVGRNIYVREGCYACHSQMIRPLRDELERYGNYSLAAESMYDRPFQWGSKRTGPDLARIGGKYSDDWHVDHMIDPRSVSPTSVMPGYPFLAKTEVNGRDIKDHLKVNAMYGVPYTDEQVEQAQADLFAQAQPDTDAAYAFEERYPSAKVRAYDGDPSKVTEMDALVAYLQMLGTLVDFKLYDEKANLR
ncbi:cytochrome-c oxidase, cbb3-type subunit II [Flexibacterium corallicola]|uniref:cytochrome-c oxidase, cbb3-type subunit II n=1 Tax=Flexibacterium corallicola TaxID=3037259 RepID=UPI00286F9436|nr:cytochrome-c oxidase, cbb3-type subunit II [Pseudovibrio sp. M1P-2-3]